MNDLKALRYSKDGTCVKLRHTKDWQTLPIRPNVRNILAINSSDLAQLQKSRLKIKAEKFQHFQQLKLSIESYYHAYLLIFVLTIIVLLIIIGNKLIFYYNSIVISS